MANKMIERTWTVRDFAFTVGLVNRGVRYLQTLKNGLGEYTQERQEWLIDHAIDDAVHAIWRLSKREKSYEQFKKEYLETQTAAFGLEE